MRDPRVTCPGWSVARLEGGRCGDRVRTGRGDRCGQEGGRGRCSGAWAEPGATRSAGPKVQDLLPRAATDGSVAGRAGRHARGDGVDRVYWKPVFHALCESDSLE